MAVAETYTPRLKERYNAEIRARLKDDLQLGSIMQSPTIDKITLNMGVGEGKTDAKQIDRRRARGTDDHRRPARAGAPRS